jgi:hypothetical protein
MSIGLLLGVVFLASCGPSGRAGYPLPEQIIPPAARFVEGPRIQVVIVTTPDAADGLTEAVASQGGEAQGHFQGLVRALMPIEALALFAELPEVQ